MKKLRGMTAGEAEKKIREDRTVYKAMEVAEAACHDIMQQVEICADTHHHIIDEPEFFVVMLLGDDSVLKTVTRRKFYAYPFLPSPRPNQSVWAYYKKSKSLQFLWALPEPMTMAALSTMTAVDPAYRNMKMWSDWFYSGRFSHYVREFFHKQHWVTEKQYLRAHSAKFIEAMKNRDSRLGADTTNSLDVDVQKLIDARKTGSDQCSTDTPRQT